jgi:hypothetical protein
MSKTRSDLYLSIDIETDGPAPGLNNMLTLGVAAFNIKGECVDQFYERIIQLPDLSPNPQTMIWWREQDPSVYKEAFDDNYRGVITGPASGPRSTAFDAMLRLAAWLNSLIPDENRLIAIAWPAAYDFAFVNYYCWRFLGQNPLGYAALDIRSYVMGIVRANGYYSLKEEEIEGLFGRVDKSGLRPHIAIDDAIGQGRLFFHIKNHPLASVEQIRQ